MKDLIDDHRANIKAAADRRDKSIVDATVVFQTAVTEYRDKTQLAANDYSAAVAASEAALEILMDKRQDAFHGVTAPPQGLPNTADGPKIAGGYDDESDRVYDGDKSEIEVERS